MKRILFGLVIMTAITGLSFAQDVLPELNDYVQSLIPADAIVISIYPNTPESAEKLLKFRLGNHNQIIDERVIGPSKNPIKTATIDAHKLHGMVALAAKIRAYVRGEAYLILYNEEDASRTATEVSSSIAFSEILSSTKEELRHSYTFRNSDGSLGYGVSLWLATSDKSSLDKEIKETASANFSGKYKAEGSSSPAEQRTAEIRKPSVETADSSELVRNVQSLMRSNSTIVRFREENKKLLGFEE